MRFISLVLFSLAFWAGSAGAETLPRGSYQQSCFDAGVSENTLRARCQYGGKRATVFPPSNATSPKTNWTTLANVSYCIGDIANVSGRLVCRRWSTQPRTQPNGPDWSRITQVQDFCRKECRSRCASPPDRTYCVHGYDGCVKLCTDHGGRL